MLTDVIKETEERFRADPTAGRTSPSVAATLANGRARLSAGPFNWDADLPASLGGGNLAPSPTAYLLGALAGCAVAFLHDTLAPQFGVRIEAITAVARCNADLRGLLGIEGASPELTDVALEIVVTSPDSEELTEPMLDAWRERCPIYLALLRPNAVALTTRVEPAV
ncbi:MAG TPA: OsmC family protein [Candidatus Limnocylindrales bacterium]|nr:OsmC family protein [Candidatus Limnocylindrales bacterium]